jgi:hypothetical protein
MNINLSEFQRVNGSKDDLLPLYITNETNETNEPNKNIISKRTATFITIGLICFLVTSVSIYDFIQSRNITHILTDDCNTYDDLMYMEDCIYKKYKLM